jgi:hypothetical protein
MILFLFSAGTEGAESARYTGTENRELKPFSYALLICSAEIVESKVHKIH